MSLQVLKSDNEQLFVQLKKYNSGVLIVVDSVSIDKSGELYSLKDLKGDKSMLYILTFNDQHNIELILAPYESSIIKGSISDILTNNIQINQSTENQIYYQFLNLLNQFENEMQAIQFEKSKISFYSTNFYTQHIQIENKIDSIQSVFNESALKIKSNYPDSYVSKVLVDLTLYPNPTQSNRNQYETNRSFLKDNYFENYDKLSQEVVNHYLFPEKLNIYLSDYYKEDSSSREVFEKIYRKADKSEVVSEYIFNFFITYFVDKNNDDALQHIYDIWNQNSCELDLIASQKNDFVKTILKHKVGNKYTNIILKDQTNNVKSLQNYVEANEITLVIFWQSSCHSCEEILPILHEIYLKYHSRKIEIFAINLDLDQNQFVQTVGKNGFSWINVWDENRVVQKQYGILQTPTLIGISSDDEISFKNIYGAELISALEKLLN